MWTWCTTCKLKVVFGHAPVEQQIQRAGQGIKRGGGGCLRGPGGKIAAPSALVLYLHVVLAPPNRLQGRSPAGRRGCQTWFAHGAHLMA